MRYFLITKVELIAVDNKEYCGLESGVSGKSLQKFLNECFKLIEKYEYTVVDVDFLGMKYDCCPDDSYGYTETGFTLLFSNYGITEREKRVFRRVETKTLREVMQKMEEKFDH